MPQFLTLTLTTTIIVTLTPFVCAWLLPVPLSLTSRSASRSFTSRSPSPSNPTTSISITTSTSTTTSTTRLFDAGENEPFFLSTSDMERLSQMKARHKTIPIMLADSLLPGQQVRLGSHEEKFQRLVETIQEEQQGELGMIGFHPLTGNPLSIGVTCTLEHVFHYGDHCSIGVHASKSFEVQGEPYLDETESFYLADIELVDERPEPALNAEEFRSAQRRHDEIPGMVETWKGLILEKKRASAKELAEILEGLGTDLPTTMKERSIWVASLVNPLPRLEESVCMEVRPAMLACRNDYDRVNLAWTSLTYSIDHLRGKGQRREAF